MFDLAEIRERLEEDLRVHIERAEKIDNRLRQPGDEDWEEQASQRINDEVLQSLSAQAHDEIDQIKRSIHRLDQGAYGVCAKCGEMISGERLELLPYTTSCANCA
ncbi:General stress protein 16O [Planctomycetes bacterium CA13]|uniref:General stress protein 16O n=1 Tax=Novipirellula herctigrandis TaxID=2527986 RepID=A0A5C5YX63_9BACT|nr:General stress protein 16O [Planctomycetes bacterium CA13]